MWPMYIRIYMHMSCTWPSDALTILYPASPATEDPARLSLYKGDALPIVGSLVEGLTLCDYELWTEAACKTMDGKPHRNRSCWIGNIKGHGRVRAYFN